MVSTPCVNNPATALKGLKPLVIRIFRILFCVDCHAFVKARPRCAPHGDDDLNKLCNDRKKSVITSDSEVIHIQKFVNFLNNNVASAHCVNNSEGRKGLKPLVIRIFRILFCVDCHAFIKARPICALHGDDRKKSVITSGSEVIHIENLSKFSTSINSDNLSRSNSSFVINNFKLIQRRIFYESI